MKTPEQTFVIYGENLNLYEIILLFEQFDDTFILNQAPIFIKIKLLTGNNILLYNPDGLCQPYTTSYVSYMAFYPV